MTKKLKFALLCCVAPSLPCALARSQSIPAGVGSAPNIGFQLPQLSGSFNYSLNASELVSTGFFNDSGTDATTSLSGDLAYLSRSPTHPFSAIYSGGVLLENSGQPNTFYQGLALSQSLTTKNWNFQVQDAVSYLPESPVTGLSGIPGVGDLGIDPVPIGPDGGIGILTQYGPRVSNTLSGGASRVITGRVSAQVNGYDSVQRFIGDNAQDGIDNSSEGGSAGVSYRFDARSSLTGNFNYSHFEIVDTPYSFTAEGETVSYSRQWTARFGTAVYAGPQRITNSDATLGPSATELSAGASASYAGRIAFYTLGYSRGVNNGSGVIPGSFSDSVVGAAHRQFGRVWSVSGSLGYSRSENLPTLKVFPFSSEGVTVGVQGVRAIGRRLSAYASYTLENQSVSQPAGLPTGFNAFNGTYQIFGVGVSYSPGSLFLGK